MKSYLNIPLIRNRVEYRHLSTIIPTYDKYFGSGWELYEGSCKMLMTKELGQCYRLHCKLLSDDTNRLAKRLTNYIR